MPGGVPEGNVFARGPRLWVTLQTVDDQVALRVDPAQLRRILALIEQRTRPPLERFMDPEKQF